METEEIPAQAMRDVAQMTVFTTYAGRRRPHRSARPVMRSTSGGYSREAVHFPPEDFVGLGWVNPGDPNEPFCMTCACPEALAAR